MEGKDIIFKEIRDTIATYNHKGIDEERLKLLKPLTTYIQNRLDAGEEIRLNFICTHNSRRSQMAQVWSQVMATYFNIPKFYAYSAGTEATALYPIVARILDGTGFKVKRLSEGENPVYAIKYGNAAPPVIGFSKELDHVFNPDSGFAAIMTCSQADEACPFVTGAEVRIALPYEDPKAFDNTSEQVKKYKMCCREIATELHYVFSTVDLNHGRE